ncbi:MAG: glucose-6-phosphate dehydrogenase [Gammaproteobacteria bacterium]|nr:glucose-6-phosphate dehydrogenase [Gammaproteobacteria bacterium]
MAQASQTASCIDCEKTEASNVVIFGATGDLTKRKLLPSLLKMVKLGLLHADSRIIGVVRNRGDDWLAFVRQALQEFSPQAKDSALMERFHAMLCPVEGDLEDINTYTRLKEALLTHHERTNALFYCAIPPGWYSAVSHHLGAVGLMDEAQGYRRLVIEKPFGHDAASAEKLNRELWRVMQESQIYRIDHYLGKESVQNLFVFRFANSLLEPLWNRNYIDHVQITASETLGVEYRAPYYEKAGALRDMIQSHLMQVMTLVAMEPPAEYSATDIRDEKVKVLRAVRPVDINHVDEISLAAQYASGHTAEGEDLAAYCTEPGVAADSSTETFAAVKFYIDNWRWQGVPFVLWTGKRMKKRVSEVMIRFRQPPHNLFEEGTERPLPNALIFRLQPDEGMFLRMNAKLPGLTTRMQRLVMSAPYESKDGDMYDAYEILLHDVLLGEASLFSRADEVETSWKIVEPIIEAWSQRFSLPRYRAGSWDVPGMDRLLKDCISGWHIPS